MTVKNVVVGYIPQNAAKLLQEIGFIPKKIAKLAEDIIKILRGWLWDALLCTNGSLSYAY